MSPSPHCVRAPAALWRSTDEEFVLVSTALLVDVYTAGPLQLQYGQPRLQSSPVVCVHRTWERLLLSGAPSEETITGRFLPSSRLSHSAEHATLCNHHMIYCPFDDHRARTTTGTADDILMHLTPRSLPPEKSQ
jgi:hypothetical protein